MVLTDLPRLNQDGAFRLVFIDSPFEFSSLGTGLEGKLEMNSENSSESMIDWTEDSWIENSSIESKINSSSDNSELSETRAQNTEKASEESELDVCQTTSESVSLGK